MNLCNKTLPKGYLLVVLSKLTNSLNLNDLGGWYCAANNPFNLLRLRSAQVFTFNLFRCYTRASDGLVVSCGQKSNDSKFHVENASLNNKKTCQTKAFDVTAEFRQSKTKSMIVLTRAEPVKANDNNLICLTAKIN